jgi:hypothetical protein
MSVLVIQIICICGYYPTLSVTNRHTYSISMYIFCMKNKYESRILMSLSFVDSISMNQACSARRTHSYFALFWISFDME